MLTTTSRHLAAICFLELASEIAMLWVTTSWIRAHRVVDCSFSDSYALRVISNTTDSSVAIAVEYLRCQLKKAASPNREPGRTTRCSNRCCPLPALTVPRSSSFLPKSRHDHCRGSRSCQQTGQCRRTGARCLLRILGSTGADHT